MSTRLVWVILFAVAVGLVLLFLMRSFQSAPAANRLARQMAAAQQALSLQFPGTRFQLQVRTIVPATRVLVISVQPAGADSTARAAMAETAFAIVQRMVDLARFDSLEVVMAGWGDETRPAKATD